MKIIIPLVGGFGKAGGWRVLSQLANYWQLEGHEVVFLAHSSTDKPYFPTTATLIFYDNLGQISTSKQNAKLPKLGAISMQKAMQKALNKLTADVVLATHSFTAKPVANSSIKAKKFYYIQAYEPDYYYKKNLKDLLYKYISKKSYSYDLVQVVNAPMYQDYGGIKTDKFVYPGLDLQLFQPKNNENIFVNEKFILGTIGRLEEYKGTTYIVEAFRKLRKKMGEKIELHMAFGDESLASTDGIKIIIPKNDTELSEYYKSINAYICAGTIQLEAVHYPVIEAMSCKVPVITTGYLPANHSNAWMIDVKNTEAIYDAVIQVMNANIDEINAKTKNAFTAIQEFRWENVSRKMLTYFQH